jgi:ATP-binding cassette subfamily C protein
VRENLLWGGAEVPDEILWETLSIAGADRLVRQMPDQLDAIVGERGMLVSGGERQRLALARAILRAPQLLILDEATSGIDIASEQILLTRLRDRLPEATIVLVAHRRESLSHCDSLLTIEAGRLVDSSGAAPLHQPLHPLRTA